MFWILFGYCHSTVKLPCATTSRKPIYLKLPSKTQTFCQSKPLVVTYNALYAVYSGTIMAVSYTVGILFVKWRSYGSDKWVWITLLVVGTSHFTTCLEMMAPEDMQHTVRHLVYEIAP